MNHDEIDDILANEVEITPSPEFLTSVMRAVARESAYLPPLEFPWKRALPGLLAVIVAVVAAVWHAISVLSDPAVAAVLDDQLGQIVASAAGFGLQWIALATAITFISIALSTSLVRSSGYV